MYLQSGMASQGGEVRVSVKELDFGVDRDGSDKTVDELADGSAITSTLPIEGRSMVVASGGGRQCGYLF